MDSAHSEHAADCQAGFDWDNTITIATEPQYYKRNIREALEIQREEIGNDGYDVINQEAGQYVTTDSWKPLLKKIGLHKDSNVQPQ